MHKLKICTWSKCDEVEIRLVSSYVMLCPVAIQVPLVRDLAIVNSSYRGNIMHLNAWQIIRVNVGFISISRRPRRGKRKWAKLWSCRDFRLTEVRVFELWCSDCNNLSYRRVCFILLYYISFIFQREEPSSKIFYLHLVADDHRTWRYPCLLSQTDWDS